MPEPPPPLFSGAPPSLARSAVAYRQARREGASGDAAMNAADKSLREVWPELSAKEASAGVVAAIAYASSNHPKWLWDALFDHHCVSCLGSGTRVDSMVPHQKAMMITISATRAKASFFMMQGRLLQVPPVHVIEL
jgi:hypothetical protein